MQAPDPIEAALARLMPTSLSPSGQKAMDEMLDQLAAEVSHPEPKRRRYPLIGLGIAAAVAALVGVQFRTPHEATPGTVAIANLATPFNAEEAHPDGFAVEWIEETDRMESLVDEGWVSNGDGMAMQAVRVRIVGENTLRDEETGYTVKISEPRSELLLMPVSSF